MGDPFGAAQTAISAALYLADVVSNIKDAAEDARVIRSELESLATCIQELDAHSKSAAYPDGLKKTLTDIVRNCEADVEELHDHLRKVSSLSLVRRIEWAAAGKPRRDLLLGKLNTHRTALVLAINITSSMMVANVADNTNAIRHGNDRMQQQLSSIVADLSSLREQLQRRKTVAQRPVSGAPSENKADADFERLIEQSATYAESCLDEGDLKRRESLRSIRRPGSITRKPISRRPTAPRSNAVLDKIVETPTVDKETFLDRIDSADRMPTARFPSTPQSDAVLEKVVEMPAVDILSVPNEEHSAPRRILTEPNLVEGDSAQRYVLYQSRPDSTPDTRQRPNIAMERFLTQPSADFQPIFDDDRSTVVGQSTVDDDVSTVYSQPNFDRKSSREAPAQVTRISSIVLRPKLKPEMSLHAQRMADLRARMTPGEQDLADAALRDALLAIYTPAHCQGASYQYLKDPTAWANKLKLTRDQSIADWRRALENGANPNLLLRRKLVLSKVFVTIDHLEVSILSAIIRATRHKNKVWQIAGTWQNPTSWQSVGSDNRHLQVLVEYGADVNAITELPGSALAEAVLHDDYDTAKYLLAAGADPDAECVSDTPGDIWEMSDNELQGVLDRRKDLAVSDKGGETILHRAVRQGKLEFAKLLCDYGANVKATEAQYGTPMHHAARYNHPEMVKLLQHYGADIHSAEGPYGTPLHVAAWFMEIDTARELLTRGANANAVVGKYCSPFMAANFYAWRSWTSKEQRSNKKRYDQMTQLLVENGANAETEGESYAHAIRSAYARDPSSEESQQLLGFVEDLRREAYEAALVHIQSSPSDKPLLMSELLDVIKRRRSKHEAELDAKRRAKFGYQFKQSLKIGK